MVAITLLTTCASARDANGGSKADAELAVQDYLAIWSRNDGVTAANVARFYAPRVTYYGKAFTRQQVLADKQVYIRRWPIRDYREVPGSFQATCDASRALCKVKVLMAWRRGDGRGHTSTGRARMSFDFVPADGARKIAREAAVLL